MNKLLLYMISVKITNIILRERNTVPSLLKREGTVFPLYKFQTQVKLTGASRCQGTVYLQKGLPGVGMVSAWKVAGTWLVDASNTLLLDVDMLCTVMLKLCTCEL